MGIRAFGENTAFGCETANVRFGSVAVCHESTTRVSAFRGLADVGVLQYLSVLRYS